MRSEAGVESRESGAELLSGEILAAARLLGAAGISDSRREALRIWSELHDTTPGTMLARREALPPGSVDRFREAIARRARGEPRQYVVGTVGFRRLVLRCDRRALIPRPETEGLVDLALAQCRTGRALDLGTGSGCLALALADEGAYRDVIGVDHSPEALELARINAGAAGLRVRWELGSWVEPVRGERFDVIVTNPPYIASGELAGLDRSVTGWEPALALDGGPDGLEAIGRVLRESPVVLGDGGWLFMEVDAARAKASSDLAQASGWRAVRVLDDVYRRPRYLAAQWEPDHA